MKILNVSYSDLFGGAAKSAYRMHRALNKISPKIRSKMYVVKKMSTDKDVISINNNFDSFIFKIKNYLGILVAKFDSNPNPKSYNFFNSPVLNYINSSKFDLINLHWINAETLSIDDVKKINKPYIITMHDMWWICGTENYLKINDNSYIKGRFANNFSKKIYEKKNSLKPRAIVCPSKWLKNITKKSKLFKNNYVFQIPYPINQKIFYPKNIKEIKNLKLKKNNKIKIFFGVFGSSNDYRKGVDLLIKSLNILDKDSFELVIASKNSLKENVSFDLINLEYINTEKELSKVYNLCDIIVLASRLDNLPNIALEAQSCGKPIVAYNVGGISDIIIDGFNGYLIKPFNYKNFAKKLKKLIKNKNIRLKFQQNAIKSAKKNWSEKNIVNKYKVLFKNLKVN